MKKLLFKIYCWFDWFDIGTYSSPPWSTLMLMGNVMLSLIIMFCFLYVLIIELSKEVFFSLIIEKIVFISWLLFVWILPLVTSVVVIAKMPYKEMIQSVEFRVNEQKMQDTWGKKPFFLRLLLYFILLVSPYLLGLLLIVFHALFVSWWMILLKTKTIVF